MLYLVKQHAARACTGMLQSVRGTADMVRRSVNCCLYKYVAAAQVCGCALVVTDRILPSPTSITPNADKKRQNGFDTEQLRAYARRAELHCCNCSRRLWKPNQCPALGDRGEISQPDSSRVCELAFSQIAAQAHHTLYRSDEA